MCRYAASGTFQNVLMCVYKACPCFGDLISSSELFFVKHAHVTHTHTHTLSGFSVRTISLKFMEILILAHTKKEAVSFYSCAICWCVQFTKYIGLTVMDILTKPTNNSFYGN